MPTFPRHFLQTLARIATALMLALLGQSQLERVEPRIFSGLLLVVAAAVLLWMPQALARLWREPRYRPALALLAVSTACVAATLHLHSAMGASATRPVAVWLIGMAVFLVACRRFDHARDDLPPLNIGWTRRDTFIVASATAIALALRVISLDRAPLTFSGDEGQMAMEAVRVGLGELLDPFATGWLGHPTLWFFLQSFSMNVFGDSVFGVRMISALLGSASIGSTYFFARLLYNRRVAALTAILLATYHFHIHFSRMALNNIADPLFGTLILSFLILGCRTRRFSMFGLTGLLLGLALYFYPGARLFVILVFCLGLLRLIPYLRRAPQARLINPWPAAFIGAGLVVAAAPLLQTFVRHPQEFMARVTVEGISRHWLETEMARTGQTALQIFWHQFKHASLAFNSYPDSDPFYDQAHLRPLLWGAAAALMLLGFLCAVFRLRRWAYQVPVLWFCLAVFFGGMMLRLPPGSARYGTLTPVVCLFIALAISQVLQQIEAAMPLSTAGRRRSLPINLAGAAFIAYLSAVSINSYFNDYIPHERLGGVNTHAANALAVYLKEQPAGAKVYFPGPPRMSYRGFATLSFIARDVIGQDVTPTLQIPQTVPPAIADHPTIYAVLPGRRNELSIIKKRYPGGESKTLTWP